MHILCHLVVDLNYDKTLSGSPFTLFTKILGLDGISQTCLRHFYRLSTFILPFLLF